MSLTKVSFSMIAGASVSPFEYGAVGNGVADDTQAINDAIATGRPVYGAGLIYKMTALPSSIINVSDAAFLVDGIVYPTTDYIKQKTAKITNAKAYTTWPQDKAYVMNNQIKVWCNWGDSHTDAQITPAFTVSDDGGVSWQELEMLDETLQGYTVWSAGIDSTYEYAFLRKDTAAPVYTYSLYRRLIPTGNTANYYSSWTITTPTFPIPAWAVETVMIHSFTVGHGGSVVVGAHDGTGCWLLRSTDQGATWTAIDLRQGTNFEEPSVKYDSASGKYYGFIRAGDPGNNPVFWVSSDNLSTFSFYEAPANYFGSTYLEDSNLAFQIDSDNILHAFAAYRNGTLAGTGDDAKTPAFYIKADLSQGDNIWNHATNYSLGYLFHAETGGASGCGQPSVVIYNDKLFLFYGSEERTGVFPTAGSVVNPINRIVNIYQTVIPLKQNPGVIDYETILVEDRSANNPFMRTPGGYGWKAKEGKWYWSVGHTLSSQYANAKASIYGSQVYDLGTATGGMVLCGTGNFAGYMAQGSGGLHGVYYDLTEGDIRFQSKNSDVFRWDSPDQRLRPQTDNTSALGAPLQRWSVVYAATGTINTSDARAKQQVRELMDAEHRAAKKIKSLLRAFRFNDAVEKKGDFARIHFGVIAQDVKTALESEGLVAEQYAFLCHDEWNEQQEIKGENGEVIKHYTPAGDRYGIRYEELLAFMIAAF